jgi:hypothetical protein
MKAAGGIAYMQQSAYIDGPATYKADLSNAAYIIPRSLHEVEFLSLITVVTFRVKRI